MSLNEQDALTDTAPLVISIAVAAFRQVAPLLLGKTGSRVRLGLQRSGTYLVVELERRPSTPAGALTAFMGNASQYLRIRIVQRGGNNKGCEIAGAREAQDGARERVSTCVFLNVCCGIRRHGQRARQRQTSLTKHLWQPNTLHTLRKQNSGCQLCASITAHVTYRRHGQRRKGAGPADFIGPRLRCKLNQCLILHQRFLLARTCTYPCVL